MAVNYWLMKSEPDVFGIRDLERKGSTCWDGVRNYLARNHMMAMKAGDRALFYHSNAKPSGVAGIAEVCRESYPDHTAFDPKDVHFDPRSRPEKPTWFMVDVKFVRAARELIPLERLKSVPGLSAMALFRHSRLSVQGVTREEWKIITALPEWRRQAV